MTTTAIATGATLVSHVLRQSGVGTVFSLAGAAHHRLLDALDRDGVRIIGSRHESATVGHADGYSRVTGRLGVALIIANQGLANAIGGIASANEACSPLLVLVARMPQSQDEPGLLQDIDEIAMARPVCKWARTVRDAERLGEYVNLACHKALSGRPGPVVLSIPADLLGAKLEHSIEEEPPATPVVQPAAGPAQIERAAALIAAAQRPLIVVGSGATRSGAGPALRRLAGELRVPVFGNALGRGLVPEDMVVGFPWPLAQVAAKEADVVVVAGVRTNQKISYGRWPRFAKSARFIQINVDAEDIGRNRHVEVPIVADAGQALAGIADALVARGYRAAGDPTWVNAALAPRLQRIEEVGRGDDGPIHAYRMARELMEVMPRHAIMVGDGADVQNWFHAIVRIHQAPGYLDHQPLGSMGIGTPLAIGAAAGAAELAKEQGGEPRPVVLVTGDGAFGFYPSEWSTAAREGLRIVCLISNDGGWGTERHAQRQSIGRTINTDLGSPRYDVVAEGFGCYGELVESPAAVGPAIRRALAADRPAVLNCITDPEAGRLRKEDPRLQMIPHEDIIADRRSHYTPPVA